MVVFRNRDCPIIVSIVSTETNGPPRAKLTILIVLILYKLPGQAGMPDQSNRERFPPRS